MASQAVATKAKRGDLAVVVSRRREYVIGQGSSESVEVVVAEVTGIFRDGLVRTVRVAGWDSVRPIARWTGFENLLLVSQAQIDVAAAMAAASAHTFPNSATPMPFASIDEARDALRPHLKPAVVACDRRDTRRAAIKESRGY